MIYWLLLSRWQRGTCWTELEYCCNCVSHFDVSKRRRLTSTGVEVSCKFRQVAFHLLPRVSTSERVCTFLHENLLAYPLVQECAPSMHARVKALTPNVWTPSKEVHVTYQLSPFQVIATNSLTLVNSGRLKVCYPCVSRYKKPTALDKFHQVISIRVKTSQQHPSVLLHVVTASKNDYF